VIREEFDGGFAYPNVRVEFGEEPGEVSLYVDGPCNHACFAPEPGPWRMRTHWWPLEVCRELDDALVQLAGWKPEVRTLYLHAVGDPLSVASADVAMSAGYDSDEFVRDVVEAWRDTLRRLDEADISVVAVIEPGSCFVGTLLELALASDDISVATDGGRPAQVILTGMNFGLLPASDGRTRLEARFADRPEHLASLAQRVGDPIAAQEVSGTSR